MMNNRSKEVNLMNTLQLIILLLLIIEIKR
nr:MAG TPA: hypothetical protein [Caudoviricetes sp.]